MYTIQLKLRSDATFGRGDGVPGLVDTEVEYDPQTGLPFLRGRALKGLLVEECDHIFFALRRQHAPGLHTLEKAGTFLFGVPGSGDEAAASMRVSAARLPRDLHKAIAADVKAGFLTPSDVLESLTTIRRQTAVSDATGAPEAGSLRALRVVLRDTMFEARLDFTEPPDQNALALLAACVRALHRAGTGRNRGRGRVQNNLCHNGQPVTDTNLAHFRTLIQPGAVV